DGEMQLNQAGEIVKKEWVRTQSIRENLKIHIDEFCVMPNHLHALIILDTPILPPINGRFPSTGEEITSFKSPSQNLGSIIRGFKASCTKQIRNLGASDFRWQKNYYDHIVRDFASLDQIRKYIINNPAKWQEDELFTL
ncbi:MAG: transposase, partial [Bacteroidota bacterium]